MKIQSLRLSLLASFAAFASAIKEAPTLRGSSSAIVASDSDETAVADVIFLGESSADNSWCRVEGEYCNQTYKCCKDDIKLVCRKMVQGSMWGTCKKCKRCM